MCKLWSLENSECQSAALHACCKSDEENKYDPKFYHLDKYTWNWLSRGTNFLSSLDPEWLKHTMCPFQNSTWSISHLWPHITALARKSLTQKTKHLNWHQRSRPLAFVIAHSTIMKSNSKAKAKPADSKLSNQSQWTCFHVLVFSITTMSRGRSPPTVCSNYKRKKHSVLLSTWPRRRSVLRVLSVTVRKVYQQIHTKILFHSVCILSMLRLFLSRTETCHTETQRLIWFCGRLFCSSLCRNGHT